MKHNRCLTTLFIGATLLLSGCKKSDAVPLADPQSAASKEEKRKEPPPSRNATAKKPAVAEKIKLRDIVQAAQAQAKEKAEAAAEKSAAIPDDKGGKLLLELLRPNDAVVLKISQGPKKLAGPASIERPTPAMPRFRGLPARFPLKPAGKTIGPRDMPEPTPLSRDHQPPKGPEEIRFSVQALERWPAPDTGEPAALPIMAQYQPDRASLTGPSGDSSRDAALAGAMPARTTPVPFARVNLPDPFENRQPIRTTAIDVEKSDPVVSTPRPLVK